MRDDGWLFSQYNSLLKNKQSHSSWSRESMLEKDWASRTVWMDVWIPFNACRFKNSEVNCLKFRTTRIINCFPSMAPALEESVSAQSYVEFKNKPCVCASPQLSPAKAAIKITNSIIYTQKRGVLYNSTSGIYGIVPRVMFMYQRFYQIRAASLDTLLASLLSAWACETRRASDAATCHEIDHAERAAD